MKPYSYLLFFAFFLTTSCTERYLLPDMGEHSVIVITGVVTNEPGPYYVRVVENISNISTGKTTLRGIDDARVTITDSNGNMDELRSFYSIPLDSVLTGSGIIYGTNDSVYYYRYFFDIPDENGKNIRFGVEKEIWDNYKIREDIREGAYFTTSTKGIPGQSYTIKVEYDGQEYTATDYMCYGTVLDSISIEPVGRYIYAKPDGTDGFMVPCLYFAEPQDEVNFYMFKESGYSVISNIDPETGFWTYESYLTSAKNLTLWNGESGDWVLSVVSDRFLPPYVSKYKMSDGDSERKWYSGTDMGFYYGWDNGGAVDMYNITEPVYRYFYALSRQYYNDGGAFSPSPASPPTNFNSGAQGCFFAASVSQYVLDMSINN